MSMHKIKINWYSVIVLVLIVIGSFLRIYNLDRVEFYMDESATALLAVNILKYGLPLGKIGDYYMVDDGLPETVSMNSDNVWVYQPWIQSYLTAFSFLFLEKNEFSARLPFVIFGILTLLFVYMLSKILYGKEVALYSMVLSSFSIYIIQHSRQTRYYMPGIFFLISCFYFFLLALNSKKRRYWMLSSISFSLLFHSNYLWAISTFVVILLYYIYTKKGKFEKLTEKGAILWCLIAILLIVPWIFYATLWRVYSSRSYGIEFRTLFYMFQIPLEHLPIPFIFIGLFAIIKNFRNNMFLTIWLTSFLSFQLLVNYPQQQGLLPSFIGFCILVGIAFETIRVFLSSKIGVKSSYFIVVMILIMTICTSLFNLYIYKISEDQEITKLWSLNKDTSLLKFDFFVPSYIKTHREYKNISISYEPVRSNLYRYITTLREDLYGPVRRISNFLKENAKEEDILISNSHDIQLSILFYNNMRTYYLNRYDLDFLKNLTKNNNLWVVYSKRVRTKNEIVKFVSDEWIKNCEQYYIDAVDLIWSNNPNFPIYEIPKNLKSLEIYYCKKK